MEINIITKNILDQDRRVEMRFVPEIDSIKLLIFDFKKDDPVESVILPFKSVANYLASVSKDRIE